MSRTESKPSINQWAEEDRPREKLLLKGIDALSDAELVAILIGSGSTSESAVELSKRILLGVENNLFELGRLTVQDLTVYKGIGEAKAISIVAAMGLAKRRGKHDAYQLSKISHAKEVARFFYPKIGEINHEEFHALYLTRANKILGSALIARGGRSAVGVDSKLVFEHAIRLQASCFIIVHNHPSGTMQPSAADIRLTQRILKCGVMMELPLIDHVIVAGRDYFSFQENDILKDT